jgi:hypothetical protein
MAGAILIFVRIFFGQILKLGYEFKLWVIKSKKLTTRIRKKLHRNSLIFI